MCTCICFMLFRSTCSWPFSEENPLRVASEALNIHLVSCILYCCLFCHFIYIYIYIFFFFLSFCLFVTIIIIMGSISTTTPIFVPIQQFFNFTTHFTTNHYHYCHPPTPPPQCFLYLTETQAIFLRGLQRF